jgi:hypothetical protein
MEKIRIRDPGSGIETIRIRDKHSGSATLQKPSLIITYDYPASEGTKQRRTKELS